MSKSNYPSRIDTSVEIPAVRDNILEVASSTINSLRSAVFQIERTLGINPHGSVGNTVAERLNQVLDGNGNILKEALDRANVLSGPILDSDIARSAAIKESKLDLNFSTSYLYQQLTTLDSIVDELSSQLNSLNSTVSAHVYEGSVNRHAATAISIEQSAAAPSSTASLAIGSDDVQSVIEDIYNSHILYDGSDISSDNASHTAEQIYFDGSNTALISSGSVQTALDDLSSIVSNSSSQHQDEMHTNGMLRHGKIGTVDDVNYGLVAIDESDISFSKQGNTSSSRISTITFDDPLLSSLAVPIKGDIISIESGDSTVDYEIESLSTDIDGKFQSVNVYGVFKDDSNGGDVATITKSVRVVSNITSLLVGIQEDASLSSAKRIQVANPNSVKVVTSNILPSAITATNRYFNISIDGAASVQIDSFTNGVNQTIDSIIRRINEQCIEQHLNILAFRIDLDDRKSEMAIVHNLPDTEDIKHTLTISRSDGAIDLLGFSQFEDQPVYCNFGTKYFIQGIQLTGLLNKLNATSLAFIAGSNDISITVDSTIDLVDSGIIAGDILTISGSQSDDGSYIISEVTSSTLTISSDNLPSGFLSDSGSDCTFYIYESCASMDSITFSEVDDSFGNMLIDVMIDQNQYIYLDKRMEYEAILTDGGDESLLTITDFAGKIEANIQLSIATSISGDWLTLSLNGGPTQYVNSSSSDERYVKLQSGTTDIELTVHLSDVQALIAKVTDDGDLTTTVYCFPGANPDLNLFIARLNYGAFAGRVIGGESSPRSISLLNKGTVSERDISSSAFRILSHQPISDTRTNGVIKGLIVSNASIEGSLYKFSISHGVAYINGRRLSISAINNYITDINANDFDKFYIYIDEYGNVRTLRPTDNCGAALSASDACIIASVENYNITPLSIFDLRLFINDIDLKLLNSISVSPHTGMGHFSSIPDAIKYAKRFSELFPNVGVPSVHIKSGTYNIDLVHDFSDQLYADWVSGGGAYTTDFYDKQIASGIWIDFPIILHGEGESSIISMTNSFEFLDSANNLTVRGGIFIPGYDFRSSVMPTDVLTSGRITIKNLKLDNSYIDIMDASIQNTDSEYINTYVDISNVIFDIDDSAEYYDSIDAGKGQVCVIIDEVGDNATIKGNICISGCNIINSYIRIDAPSRVANISILNNTCNGAPGDSTSYLLYGNIYDLADAGSETNINIFGNICLNDPDANGVSGPYLVNGIDPPEWGDRISRDLLVGNNITAGNSVTASSYIYASTKTKSKLYTAMNMLPYSNFATSESDFLPWTAASASRAELLITTQSDDYETYSFPVASIENVSVANDCTLRFPIDIKPSEVLTSFEIACMLTSTITNWTVTIYKFEMDGINQVGINRRYFLIEDSATAEMGVGNVKTIQSIEIPLSVTGDSPTALYIAEITHDIAAGIGERRIIWVRANYNISTVEIASELDA